jgi:hypothetical protein
MLVYGFAWNIKPCCRLRRLTFNARLPSTSRLVMAAKAKDASISAECIVMGLAFHWTIPEPSLSSRKPVTKALPMVALIWD